MQFERIKPDCDTVLGGHFESWFGVFRGFCLNAPEQGRATTSLGWTPSARLLAAFYALLFVIACIPLFAVDFLPLGDALNHAVRAYILNNLDTEPFLRKYYAARWELFSFQSTDLLLPPLAQWLGVGTALRLFVVVTLAMLIGGTVAVHRVLFGRVGLWPAAAFLFLLNFPLMSGQIGYLFSTGLGLLLFAAWMATERWSPVIRVPVFALASFGLLLCHFFALAAYALLVMSFALGQAWRASRWGERLRRLIVAGLPFVAPGLCFLLFFGQTIAGATSYGVLIDKTIALLVGTLAYGRWPDTVLNLAVISILWWLNRRRRVTLAAGMGLPVIVLVLTALAMPSLLRGVFGADLRLPLLLYFLLVAASDVRFEGRQPVIAFAGGVFALLVLRVVTTTLTWSHADADYREFRAADHVLEQGSRVAVIKVRLDHRAAPQPQTPYWFISCFAVIDRQAFVPQMYTLATPLRLTAAGEALNSDTLAQQRKIHWQPAGPAFAATDAETVRQVEQVGQRMSEDDVPTSTIDWSDWPERFDYIIDYHMGEPRNPVPALLTEVWAGSYFTIYHIHPPQ